MGVTEITKCLFNLQFVGKKSAKTVNFSVLQNVLKLTNTSILRSPKKFTLALRARHKPRRLRRTSKQYMPRQTALHDLCISTTCDIDYLVNCEADYVLTSDIRHCSLRQ